jgi:predicted signal transduction protein with EAL and GGDEF domain
VVQLAKALGMTTTAEGIETEAQLDLIREAGCTLGQGFLLSTPLTAVQITRILAGGPIPLPAFATAREGAHDRVNRAPTRRKLHA